jgi:small subunit ribosomal protein S8
MSMSDPLADMLTRIRNAGMANFRTVDVPLSNLKLGVAKVLRDEGYIEGFTVLKDTISGTIRIDLKYTVKNEKAVSGLRRVSKPGMRIYVKADKIPKVMSGLGIAILSTSKGVITDRQARELGVGGEILCNIW